MKRKIIAALLLFTMLITITTFAEYPSSNGTVNFDEVYDVTGTSSWASSAPKNIFTVDGKSFILLDTDAEGNYFVLAEEHYGTYPFEQNIPNSIQLNSIDDIPDADSWRFNPARKTNIAYWLNHDFVTNGNTDEFKLPDSVYENIIEKNWDIEGFQAFSGSTAVQNYDKYFNVSTAANYAAQFSGSSYGVTAKIALLSYSEYLKYKDKIGITFNNSGGWSGMLLRTCDSLVTCTVSGNERTLNLIRSPLMVRTKNTDINDKGNLTIRFADAISSNYYYVRPCFWLSKDFFKNVRCDIEYDANGNPSIGAEPLKKIQSHTYSELKSIYSDSQLESLGFEVPVRNMGNYPSHPSEIKDLGAKEQGDTGLAAYYESPEENLFTVDGKTFILLDRFSDGSYFVMANDEYGQHAFSTDASVSGKESTDADWYFNPSNQSSIAYWLNNDFLENGGSMLSGGGKIILPESIRNNLVDYDWEIEPHYPINGWQVGSYASEQSKAEVEQWRQRQLEAAQKRVARCKVALMSYTEYQQYKDKIGLTVLADGYAGFSLRTPRAQANASSDGSWSVLVGPLQVANNTSQNKLVFTTAGVNNAIYYVRPVFRLSSGFFRNSRIDIAGAGETVKNEIAHSYDYFDMKGIYSDDEIRELGISVNSEETDAIPEADVVFVSGIPGAGNTVKGEYKYISNDEKSRAASERNSVYTWYISETETGPWTECSYDNSYEITDSDSGKYLKFGVKPRNAYGTTSEKEYFSRAIQIGSRAAVEVDSITVTDTKGNEVYNLNGLSTLYFHISLKADSDCVMYIAAYSADGKQKALKTMQIGTGTSVQDVELSADSFDGGSYARVLIFKADDLTTPIYSKKF